MAVKVEFQLGGAGGDVEGCEAVFGGGGSGGPGVEQGDCSLFCLCRCCVWVFYLVRIEGADYARHGALQGEGVAALLFVYGEDYLVLPALFVQLFNLRHFLLR